MIIRVGQTASFKLPFEGRDPMRIQWYREGEELLEDTNIKIEKSTSHSSLKLSKCQRKESGEIKIRLRNDFGTLEAFSRLIVLGEYVQFMEPKWDLSFIICKYKQYFLVVPC